jgi:hypothetical protein
MYLYYVILNKLGGVDRSAAEDRKGTWARPESDGILKDGSRSKPEQPSGASKPD